MRIILPTLSVAVVLLTFAACSKPQPPPSASSPDGNAAGTSGKPESGRTGASTPPSAPALGNAADDSEPAAAAEKPETKPGAKASQAECDRSMDKYLELEMASNPALKDVPPELVAQAKAMAREAHGAPPCTATRAQYTCAMAATSTAAWQKCMK